MNTRLQARGLAPGTAINSIIQKGHKENPDQVNGDYWPLLYKRADLDLKSTNVFRQNQCGQKDYLACPDMSVAGAEVNNGLCS